MREATDALVEIEKRIFAVIERGAELLSEKQGGQTPAIGLSPPDGV
jgi:hypothetical protein